MAFEKLCRYIQGMPVKNVLKPNIEESYYHVYSRGVNKQTIFHDDTDFTYFIGLFNRYLLETQQFNRQGVPYAHLVGKIELLCFCLMPNHFHLLVYQISPGAMTCLMQSLLTSYSRYYNFKYKRRGPLFESRYKAAHINDEAYLTHISRYIHLNPRYWIRYPYSSLSMYLRGKYAQWLKPERIVSQLLEGADYHQFLLDYEAERQVKTALKYELADH